MEIKFINWNGNKLVNFIVYSLFETCYVGWRLNLICVIRGWKQLIVIQGKMVKTFNQFFEPLTH